MKNSKRKRLVDMWIDDRLMFNHYLIKQQVKKKSKPGQPKVRMERSALDVDGYDDNEYDDFI